MARVAVIFASITVLVSCHSALERVDRQVTEMIRESQASTLGPADTNDPQVVPQTLHPSGKTASMYDSQPPTRNPTIIDLPAETNSLPNDSSIEVPKTDSANGGEVIIMDLEKALHHAITHSREYRSRKEELFLVTLDLLVERHLWGPQFFHDIISAFTGTPEAGDHDQVMSLVNELRATQRLPYGGDLSISALVTYVNVLQNATGLSPSQSQSAELRLSLTQPLLRGFGEVAKEDLIRAHRELVYAVRRFERFRREFLVDVAEDYYDLIVQQAGIENRKVNVNNFELLAQRFEALAEAGRAAYFEAESFQQQVLFARNDLFTSQQAYDNALDTFKIRIGMPIHQAMNAVASEVVISQPLLASTKAVATAIELRLDLQITADMIDDARRKTQVARNALFPDLNILADIHVPTDPDKEEGGFNLSFHDAIYTAGATFSSPLERTTQRALYRRALIDYERAHRSYTLHRDQVAREVRDTVRGIQQARYSLQLQKLNMKLAEKSRLGVKLRERQLGLRDVIDSEEDLLEAKNRYDDAIRNTRVRILRYLLSTGQIRVSAAGQWQLPAKLIPLDEHSAGQLTEAENAAIIGRSGPLSHQEVPRG